jgi:DNA-binding CsgD family transcriptional regulator
MFWKFLIVILVFVIASLTVRGFFVSLRLPSVTLIDSTTTLLFRTIFALAVLVIIARFNRSVNFGKLFLLAMVGVAVALALMPLLPIYNILLGSLIGFANSALDLIFWCLLSTIVYEKNVSSLVTFGFGRGVLLVGQAIGWFLGMRFFPSLVATMWEGSCYLLLAFFILLATTLLFSEKEFGRMFAPLSDFNQEKDTDDVDDADESGLTLSDEDKQPNPQQKLQRRPWLKACKSIGRQAKLTAREQEILEMMAFGRSPEGIAQRLFVSLNTVRTHVHNIYSKLNVHSKQELTNLIERERNS